MKFKIFLIFMLLFNSDALLAQKKKKNMRKASSSRSMKKNIFKSGGRESVKNTSTTTTTSTSIQTTTTTDTEINSGNCDSYYTRCMNKICSNNELGKCVCYEDKSINNTTPSFIDIDGMKMKQGFETFEYAKRQCVYILDQCMEQRRGITEKYKNLVQRDCLMLTEKEAEKPQGLAGDLENLKSCMRDYCTSYIIEGYEDFSSPEYSLCFSESYSKFAMDAYCSNIIAKSSSPLGLKQLFLDEMALNREKSCIAMNGNLSNDRKICYVEIKYGLNKNDIKGSKQVPAGSYFECSASTFNVKKNETRETRQRKFNQILSLSATALNSAGTVLSSIGGKADPIGSLIDLGIGATESAINLGIEAKNTIETLKYTMSNAFESEDGFANLLMTVIPIAQNIGTKKQQISNTKYAIQDTIDNVKLQDGLSSTLASSNLKQKDVSISKDGDNVIITQKSAKAKGFETAGNVLNYVSMGLQAGAQITDIAMTNKADKLQMEEEKKGIIDHAIVDREAGVGEIYDTLTEKGNCFLNGEWFATENENIIIMWKY